MKINNETIAIYRDIYYEHVKPMIKNGDSADEIDNKILPVLIKYGWTLEIYALFHSLDFLQRIAYTMDRLKLEGKKPNLNVVDSNHDAIDYSNVYQYPELRCPLRSEEQRNLN